MCISESIKQTLIQTAQNSEMNVRHAAAILINGKIVSTGINCFHGKANYHAEADALRSLFNSYHFRSWEKPYITPLRNIP